MIRRFSSVCFAMMVLLCGVVVAQDDGPGDEGPGPMPFALKRIAIHDLIEHAVSLEIITDSQRVGSLMQDVGIRKVEVKAYLKYTSPGIEDLIYYQKIRVLDSFVFQCKPFGVDRKTHFSYGYRGIEIPPAPESFVYDSMRIDVVTYYKLYGGEWIECDRSRFPRWTPVQGA